MRIRQVLAGSGIVVLAVFAGASAASATEEPTTEDPEISHAAEECIHILEDGGEPDECHEAPSPILPEANEVIWGSLAFVVLFVFMWRFGLPAIRDLMRTREDRIRTDLEQAESTRTEAEGVLAQYQAQLNDARVEAGRIVEEARAAADQVRRDLIARAEVEAAELRTRNDADLERAAERAIADIRRQTSDLSIVLAEKIVERNLDAETQRRLIESYIDQVGSN